MLTLEKSPTFAPMADLDRGALIGLRRLNLGLTRKALAERAGIDRGRLAALEDGDSTVRETTMGAVERALSALEQEMGTDTASLVTSVIELPGGQRVSFSGPADAAAEAASRFLEEQSRQDDG